MVSSAPALAWRVFSMNLSKFPVRVLSNHRARGGFPSKQRSGPASW
jgi:hypothetical protein